MAADRIAGEAEPAGGVTPYSIHLFGLAQLPSNTGFCLLANA